MTMVADTPNDNDGVERAEKMLGSRKTAWVKFAEERLDIPSRMIWKEGDQMTPTERRLRAAVLDVIDTGYYVKTTYGNGYCNWKLYETNEDEANSQRLDFADAVIARLRQLEVMGC